MLPLNDTEPNRYSFFPIVTILLISVNCFIFYIEPQIVRNGYWEFYMKYATTPTLILNADGGGALSNITTMFLHGDLFHLLETCLPCGSLEGVWKTPVAPGDSLLSTCWLGQQQIFCMS